MIILGIETSCDETAISIIEAKENLTGETKSAGGSGVSDITNKFSLRILNSSIISQIDIHKEFVGVFPMMAKREHAKNILPLLEKAISEAKISVAAKLTPEKEAVIKNILQSKEPELCEALLKSKIISSEGAGGVNGFSPKIDYIAVTEGPGLEPALWVGINFALALGELLNIPVIPVNHMEGHIVASLLPFKKLEINDEFCLLKNINYPALALLISGGHTEIVHIHKLGEYTVVGKTRDDAVGEAFDKVARLMGLPYPGGPEISKLAKKRDEEKGEAPAKYPLPRPMIHSKDFDFSFSGIKTAVLYTLKAIPEITGEVRKEVAWEFERAAAEVLSTKTLAAARELCVSDIILGGGVSMNSRISHTFTDKCAEEDLTLYLPPEGLTGDNAVMIGIAGIIKIFITKNETEKKSAPGTIRARGNLSIESNS